MANASVVGIFDSPIEAKAAVRQLTDAGIDVGKVSVVANNLTGTWTVRGYVRSDTGTERNGRFLAVVRGEATEIAEAARILRNCGAAHVDSLTALVRDFLLATPARDRARAARLAHGRQSPETALERVRRDARDCFAERQPEGCTGDQQ